MLVGVRTSPVLPNIRQFLDCQLTGTGIIVPVPPELQEFIWIEL